MRLYLPAAWWYVAYDRSANPTAFLVGDDIPELIAEPESISVPSLRQVRGLSSDFDWRSFHGVPVRPVLSPDGQPASIASILAADRTDLLGAVGGHRKWWQEHPCSLDATGLPAYLRTPHPQSHMVKFGKQPRTTLLHSELVTSRVARAAIQMCVIDGLLYWPAPLPGWMLSLGEEIELSRCAWPILIARPKIPRLFFANGNKQDAEELLTYLGGRRTDLPDDTELDGSTDWADLATLRSITYLMRVCVDEAAPQRDQFIIEAGMALLERDGLKARQLLARVQNILQFAGEEMQRVGEAVRARSEMLDIDPRDLEALANL